MENVSVDRLKTFIDKIERLEEQKTELLTLVKEVFDEAKGEGFDVPTLKKVIRLRKMKHEDLQEQDALLETYRNAVGV